MAKDSANIESPEVIKDFRNQVVGFEESSRQALSGIKSDIRKTLDWLKHDRLVHWKAQLRRRSEDVVRARQAYTGARNAPEPTRKNSFAEEQKALQRAIRRKEEAERKIRLIRNRTVSLEQQAARLIGPCHSLSSKLDTMIPAALARLDRMLDNLEKYFGPSAPGEH